MTQDSEQYPSRFVLDPFEPAYRSLARAEIDDRVAAARRELEDCHACPRACRVDRAHGETGICHTGRHACVASAGPHLGEEDCLRGWSGSGTIFFARCNLHCVYCQNADISQRDAGTTLGTEGIAELMLSLQSRGCHNVNLVTPSHVVPQVIQALATAIERGLSVPVVYNTSAYDTVRSLRLLEGLVDIYMPDFKYWGAGTAKRLSRARDYPERARRAIAEMHRQVGPLALGPDGLARRGVLVRHLVLPGRVGETRSILRWLATALGQDTYLNLMAQYRPAHRVGEQRSGGSSSFRDLDRRVSGEELQEALATAREVGLWRLDGRVAPARRAGH